jgi:hypothetical protein
VTGFRIGELLTLPLDCEVEEPRGGKQQYGLRYYKEKARGGERMFAVRWLTDVGAELARRGLERSEASPPRRGRRRAFLSRSLIGCRFLDFIGPLAWRPRR